MFSSPTGSAHLRLGMVISPLVLAGGVPMLIIVLFASGVLYQRKARKERPPIQDKLLRLPGHTLRRKLEELWEGFTQWAFCAALFAICFAVQLMNTKGRDTTAGLWVAVLIFGASTAVCTIFATRKLSALTPIRLGLLGEQAVAEQLQTLAAQGYRVFHDIPGDGPWNIDHVVVGPVGVFAIETKCRAKRPAINELRDQDAVFDGDKIRFPWCDDYKSVPQAARNAKWLGEFLSKAVGERIVVRGLVALPGWWVTLKAKSEVLVLSGKQVPGYIVKEPNTLSTKAVQQIAWQLEQRCRDVEF